MVRINNNTIQMTRGDTLTATISISTSAGEAYEPQEGDSVRFALKHSRYNANRTEFSDAEPLLVVQIPTDTLILEITPDDTKNLEFGEYVYDIELTMADGTVDTFIAEARLLLRPEVY